MTKGLIIDGWNLFGYEGIPNEIQKLYKTI